jgi:hypothetical protein
MAGVIVLYGGDEGEDSEAEEIVYFEDVRGARVVTGCQPTELGIEL